MTRKLILSALTMTLLQASAWACPMCKVALETDDPQPQAYMISILFMLGTITTLFCSVGGVCWWINRKERQALEDAGYGHLFVNGATVPQPVE